MKYKLRLGNIEAMERTKYYEPQYNEFNFCLAQRSNELIENLQQLSIDGAPEYKLDLTYKIDDLPVMIRYDSVATERKIIVTVNYLLSFEDQKKSGSIEKIGVLYIPKSAYAYTLEYEKCRNLIMNEIMDQLEAELLAFNGCYEKR